MMRRLDTWLALIVVPLGTHAVFAAGTVVFDAPPRHVPTLGMPDGPLLGNGDVGVVLAGPPEAQTFYIGENDFWRRPDASVETVGNLTLAIPASQGASYRQEQDLATAEVCGTFTEDGTTVRMRSWVEANENLLVTRLQCDGGKPVDVLLRQSVGESVGDVLVAVADNNHAATIDRVSNSGGRWYFDGSIADVSITPNALSTDEVRALAGKPAPASAAKVFDGRSIFDERPAPKISKAVSVSAWIKIEGASRANYVVSKGDWNQACGSTSRPRQANSPYARMIMNISIVLVLGQPWRGAKAGHGAIGADESAQMAIHTTHPVLNAGQTDAWKAKPEAFED